MLEYDYAERMNAKDLALMLNRELTEDKVQKLKKVTNSSIDRQIASNLVASMSNANLGLQSQPSQRMSNGPQGAPANLKIDVALANSLYKNMPNNAN